MTSFGATDTRGVCLSIYPILSLSLYVGVVHFCSPSLSIVLWKKDALFLAALVQVIAPREDFTLVGDVT